VVSGRRIPTQAKASGRDMNRNRIFDAQSACDKTCNRYQQLRGICHSKDSLEKLSRAGEHAGARIAELMLRFEAENFSGRLHRERMKAYKSELREIQFCFVP